MTRVRAAVVAVAAALVLLFWWLAWPHVAAAALLLDLSGATAAWRSLVPVRVHAVGTYDISVPTRHGAIAARLYTTDAPATRAIVVVPGVHGGGADEPRLDRLARRLAGAGATILSLPLPDLRAYRVVPRATDMLEDGAVWLADYDRRTWSRVGLMGVSFSGGLAIVAAGRPALRHRLTAVVSLGGHGDLPRALRYLCTGALPGGGSRAPHDYSLAVLLRAAIPSLVPAAQADAVDRALVAFLDGSSLAARDPSAAAALIEESHAIAAELGEPGRSIMASVHERRVAEIGARLLPLVESLGGDPALSPERSPAPTAPVFLVHGRDDNVIPSSETPLVAAYLSGAGTPAVRWLLTPLVTHADVHPDAHVLDRWRLVGMWTAIWHAFGE